MLDLNNSQLAASEEMASVSTADTGELTLGGPGALGNRDAHPLDAFFESDEEGFSLSKANHDLAAYGYTAAERRATAQGPDALRPSADGLEAAGHTGERLHVAHAAPPQANHAIGSVEAVTGSVSVVRNGLTVTLHAGDPVYKGDVVQTEAGGAAKLNLTNGVALNLGHSANVVLNDMPHVSVTAPVLPQNSAPLVPGSLSQIPSAPSDKPVPQAPDQGHVSFAPGSSTPPTVLGTGLGLPASGVSQSISPPVASNVAQAGQPSATSLNPSLVTARTDAQGETPPSISSSATSPTTSPFPGANSPLSSTTVVFVPTQLFVPAARDAAIQPAGNSSGGIDNPASSTAVVDAARGAGSIPRDASDGTRGAARDIGDGVGQVGRVAGDAIGNVAGSLSNGVGQGGSASGPFGNAAGAADNVAGPPSISLGLPDRASGTAGNAPSAAAGGLSNGLGQAGSAAGEVVGASAAPASNSLGQAGNVAGAVGNAVGQAGGAAGEAVSAAAGVVINGLGEAGNATRPGGSNAVESAIGNAAGAVGNGVGQAGNAAGAAVGAVGSGLGQAGDGVAAAIGAIGNNVGQAGGASAEALGASVGIVGNGLGQAGNAARPGDNGVGQAGDAPSGAVAAAAGPASNGPSQTGNGVATAVGAVGTGVDPATGAEGASSNSLGQAGNAAGPVGNAVDQTGGASGEAVGVAAGAASNGGLGQAGNGVATAIDVVETGSDPASGAEGGGSAVGLVGDATGETVGAAAGAVSSSLSQAADAAGRESNAAGSAIGSAASAGGNGVGQAGSAAGSAEISVAGPVRDELGQVNAAESALGNSFDQQVDTAREVVRAVADAAGGGLGRASIVAGGAVGDAARGDEQANATAGAVDVLVSEADGPAGTEGQEQSLAAGVSGAMATEESQVGSAGDATGKPAGAAGIGEVTDLAAAVVSAGTRGQSAPAVSTARDDNAGGPMPVGIEEPHTRSSGTDAAVSAADEHTSVGQVLDSTAAQDQILTDAIGSVVSGQVATRTLPQAELVASSLRSDTGDAHLQIERNSASNAAQKASDPGSANGAEEAVSLTAQTHKTGGASAVPDLNGANGSANEAGGQARTAAHNSGIQDHTSAGAAIGVIDPDIGSGAGETQGLRSPAASYGSAASDDGKAAPSGTGTTTERSDETVTGGVTEPHKVPDTAAEDAAAASESLTVPSANAVRGPEEYSKTKSAVETNKLGLVLDKENDTFLFTKQDGKPSAPVSIEDSPVDFATKYSVDAASSEQEMNLDAHAQSSGSDGYPQKSGLDTKAPASLATVSTTNEVQVFTSHVPTDGMPFA
ncbi:hypothetical protein [Methylobacterium oxalidis]|uniref:Uncharacterized protein n=1 Tax=Methylobacterium oxalidis TaxID=944322 RepID=A0A512JBB6_9HYPH|nr:hypothetical protein [Methylobacterium oxalidis]GEP07191.1 hypothetical protein MOX02_52290 [Methylobacterium oxalidis]GJE31484.1 hypothetical protein LDDCCGHA_1663 [Methylobacterium oxalidis]GLS65797.1 hypothetical protein GCM10007888_41790 [Methylobacterium oxalidis]